MIKILFLYPSNFHFDDSVIVVKSPAMAIRTGQKNPNDVG